jgi:multimeric flavodoxin WrbA
MGSVGIEGISAMTWARLKASVSYSVPAEVMSFDVRNLKIRGARGCFSSPADLMRVQQRWMKIRF